MNSWRKVIHSFLTNSYHKLSRTSHSKKIIQEIDGLRFLAAFPVVIQHLTERITRDINVDFHIGLEYMITYFLTSRGFIGVYIFFIVSGFVMTIPFANYYLFNGKEINIKRYYKNRFSRILPPYTIALFSCFIILVIINYQPISYLFEHFLASVFFLHNVIYTKWSPINPTIWTLEIQVQFYMLLPLLAYLTYKFRSTLHRRVFLVLFLLGLHVFQDYFSIITVHKGYFNILGNLQYFLVGILLADIYLIELKNKNTRSYFFDILAALALISSLLAWSWDHNIYSRLLFLTLLFIFFYSLFRSIIINKFLSLKWIIALGSMCFTIYLVHLPLAEFFIVLTKNIHYTNYLSVNVLIQTAMYLPLLIVVSSIFFILIEKPSMQSNWIDDIFNLFKKHKTGVRDNL